MLHEPLPGPPAPLPPDNLRGNEDKLKAAVEDAQTKLAVSEQRYQKLKDHAEGRILRCLAVLHTH